VAKPRYTLGGRHLLTPKEQQWAFDGLNTKLSSEMIASLEQPLSLAELTKALSSMASRKSPGPNGIITELYKKLWPCIGPEYLTMLHDSITRGALPNGVTKGIKKDHTHLSTVGGLSHC
jgi:hypothetical protein